MPSHRKHAAAAHHAKNPVDAVKRINRRWIVHGGLRESAEKYLAELERCDPGRLHRSCGLAMALVHSAPAGRDPKPWFYAGLFAMATPDEAERTLGKHRLTRTTWEILNDASHRGKVSSNVRALAGRIAREIREGLSKDSARTLG